ncbi:hypothetical protein TNCV_3826751 [Trichonephila clavipes]|nr:hypothetical protein TNCV_3826751 [Trichonephila clavipes]
MRSGDFLVEVSTTKQAEQLLTLQMLANIPITVLPHANLNSSRGVISESETYTMYQNKKFSKAFKIRKFVRSEESLFDVMVSASVIVILNQPVVENPLVLVAVKWDTTAENVMVKKNALIAKATTHRTHAHATWKLEKEIITVKIKNRLTYPEARLAVTNRTPIQGFSYAAVAKKNHYKLRSRRRKTSQTSDAMDTDVNPSDTDYVIGQASEEDESLLEANFKQATSNPLTGTLLPLSPKK